jgi:hypothetical protein
VLNDRRRVRVGVVYIGSRVVVEECADISCGLLASDGLIYNTKKYSKFINYMPNAHL